MITLLWYTPYEVLMKAIRVSHASLDQMDTVGNILGEKDKKLLKKIITLRHDSVLEHINYSFYIQGISRALLQELVRHRFVSFTVQSTRFALKKLLKNEDVFVHVEDWVDNYNQNVLEYIKEHKDKPNDVLKYLIPEAFKTELVMTTNARELDHIIKLRSQKGVLPEFQKLAQEFYETVSKIHPELWGMLKCRS